MVQKKKILVIIYALIIILCLTGCSSSKTASSTQNAAMDKSTKSNAELSVGNKGTENVAKSDSAVKIEAPNVKDASKIVKTYTIQLQTLKFDNAITSISNKCIELGGYVESSNISGTDINADNTITSRSASLKLRIPKEQYIIFKTFFKGLGSIISQQETGENITQQYFDTDAHLASLKIQEERMLELLKKSGDLKSILEIEKELVAVRYSIEGLTTSLKKMDNLVDYTTFTISLNEVQQIKNATKNPVSLMDKISEGFKGSVDSVITIFKNILIIIAYVLPFAVIILIAYVIGLYFYKVIKKSQKKTK